MTSHKPAAILPSPPDIIPGNMPAATNGYSPPHSSFSFMPIGPAPSSACLPPTVKPSPVPNCKGVSPNFIAKPTPLPRYQAPPVPMRFPSSYITGLKSHVGSDFSSQNVKSSNISAGGNISSHPASGAFISHPGSFSINTSLSNNTSPSSLLSRSPRLEGCMPNSRVGPIKLKRKGNDFGGTARVSFDNDSEPKPKLHLNEEFVTQTMSELYISHPRPKVARRSANCDVAETTNMVELQELEEKFTQAAITGADHFDLSLPPQRCRKLPSRNNSGRTPTLRLSLHQDFKNFKATANIVPDSLVARYRPSPRERIGGSTALVLWRPPGGIVPDVISSALKTDRGGRSRSRYYSEVTSTPYSSHENLADSDMLEVSRSRNSVRGLFVSPQQLANSDSHSPVSAEAPELTHPSPELECEEPILAPLQRRNSAPEICEPLPFVDDGSMEL